MNMSFSSSVGTSKEALASAASDLPSRDRDISVSADRSSLPQPPPPTLAPSGRVDAGSGSGGTRRGGASVETDRASSSSSSSSSQPAAYLGGDVALGTGAMSTTLLAHSLSSAPSACAQDESTLPSLSSHSVGDPSCFGARGAFCASSASDIAAATRLATVSGASPGFCAYAAAAILAAMDAISGSVPRKFLRAACPTLGVAE
mmetsp:Transcript_7894/g.35830  ORF Transcript_7894/g.35830 Transcript_7894/m.35830 type:complete len:203 (+) Transcript_7894:1948-2556(+)